VETLKTSWPRPARILLLTYDRADHLVTTADYSVIGIPKDRASVTKAKRVRADDWFLIRLSEVAEFRASRPGRITGRGLRQTPGSPYPNLLWPEEVESSNIVYPFRIPITFEGGPPTKPGCISWTTLIDLGLRGKDGSRLETPQQWGIKFRTNILEDPGEVDSFLKLIARCAP